MKLTRLFTAGCLAAALLGANAFAQDEPVEVRVRAIAKPDGKVEVVEERIIGPEKSTPKKKSATAPDEDSDKDENATLRARVFRRVQGLGEKVAEAAAGSELLGTVTEDVWGEMPASDYWIGVQIAPVAPEIRKHMSVKHGVLVVHVYPDSPATKADVKADDILLQAGDAKIETGPDLVKAIDAAKETELSFLVLREGKEQTVTITPKKREEANKALTLTRTAPAPRLEKLQAAQRQFEKALEALRAETQQEEAVDFMLVRPGAFMYQAAEAKMPDDLTVQITKEGNKPAKVHVKKGDKSWDATSDKLDALPKEIRPHVEHLLSGSSHQGMMSFTAPLVEDRLRSTIQMKVAPSSPGAPVAAPYYVAPPVTQYSPRVTEVPATPAVPRVVGIPPTPAGPGMVPAVARAATAWSHAVATPASDPKLDLILKKLDSLASPDLDDIKKELKALRKEVDELRKRNAGS